MLHCCVCCCASVGLGVGIDSGMIKGVFFARGIRRASAKEFEMSPTVKTVLRKKPRALLYLNDGVKLRDFCHHAFNRRF